MTGWLPPWEDRPGEEWRPLPGSQDIQVSNLGRVRLGNDTDQVVTQSITRKGYKIVTCEGRTRNVHSMVLTAFVGLRPEGMWARHLDGNSYNNCIENLCWDTPTANIHDKIRHGTICCGEKFWSAKLKESDIPEIFALARAGYKRQAIADRFDVTYTTIFRVLNRETWKHVEIPQ